MKLFLFRPVDENAAPWFNGYDKSFGFVVRAEDEGTARALASRECGDEGAMVWHDPQKAGMTILAEDCVGDPAVVMRDFAAG